MDKQDIEFKIVIEFKIEAVRRSIDIKTKELQSDKKYLKYLEKQLQEVSRGVQRDMFEIDIMYEVGGWYVFFFNKKPTTKNYKSLGWVNIYRQDNGNIRVTCVPKKKVKRLH